MFPLLSIVLFLLLLICKPVFADYKEDIGYTRLANELGAGIPDGTNVLDTQVEAGQYGTGYWHVDTLNGEFTGKSILHLSDGVANPSSHATTVGRYYYGNSLSIAPGISNINVYEANDWLQSGYLKSNSLYSLPEVSSSRVANHSWVGEFDEPYAYLNPRALRRLDWVIETDEYIQVTALNNGTTAYALLSYSYSAITVGKTDGFHPRGTGYIDDDYPAGRVRPDVVVPLNKTSYTAPVVAAAASLLVDTGHSQICPDTDPVENYTISRNNDILCNAERTEVIKAAIMAGADRKTDNTVSYDVNGEPFTPNITDYRSAGNASDNGLDIRYGAGQLNIYNSYRIIAGGEQNSLEDSGAGEISSYGFDYDPSFGTAGDNDEATYPILVVANDRYFQVSLVWNIDITSGSWAADLNNLDLYLERDIDGYDNWHAVVSSNSSIDNTENIRALLVANNKYRLRVMPTPGESFEWNYALAWRMEDALLSVPGPGLVLVPAGLVLLLIGLRSINRKKSHQN